MQKLRGLETVSLAAKGMNKISPETVVNNQFPSATQRNAGIAVNPANDGLSPNSKLKSLLKENQSARQNMITRLWHAQGATWEACERYVAKAAGSWDHVTHTWLVGVTDPTHAIPYGHVFITGFSKMMSHIFCTRSPCIQPDRGRMLKLLTEKPVPMSPKHWEILQRLDFGAIVFPNAPQGPPFLPPPSQMVTSMGICTLCAGMQRSCSS